MIYQLLLSSSWILGRFSACWLVSVLVWWIALAWLVIRYYCCNLGNRNVGIPLFTGWPTNLDSRPFVIPPLIPPPSPTCIIPQPARCYSILHPVAVITPVFLVLFSHDHPDKKVDAFYVVVNDEPYLHSFNVTRPCRMGQMNDYIQLNYHADELGSCGDCRLKLRHHSFNQGLELLLG